MEVFNFFFQQSPKITKILTLSSILISLLTWFEIVSPLSLYLNYSLIFKKCQIWRIFTNFFYFGDFSLSLLFHMLIFFRNSKLLEKKIFKGSAPDYLYFILFCMVFLLIFNPFARIIFLSESLSFAMTYYWGRKSKTTNVEFMGVFTFRAPYLPWFYLVISFLLESDFKNDFYGLIIGHLYFYLKEILPRLKSVNNIKILETPKFFKKLCDKLDINNEFIVDVEDADLLF